MADSELLLWRQQVALCLSDYASPECCKPNHRRLQWIVSRRTAQNLHSHRSVPELPTIPEGRWDESERSEQTLAPAHPNQVHMTAAMKTPGKNTHSRVDPDRNNTSLVTILSIGCLKKRKEFSGDLISICSFTLHKWFSTDE